MKSYLRFLSRNKLYTAIEVVGLSVALAFMIILGSILIDKSQVNDNIKDADEIYSLAYMGDYSMIGQFGAVGTFLAEIPMIKETCRFSVSREVKLRTEEGENLVVTPMEVSSNFFSFFGIELTDGDEQQALKVNGEEMPFVSSGIAAFHGTRNVENDPLKARGNVVLAQHLANALYPDRNPIGKTISLHADWDIRGTYTITGVAEGLGKCVLPECDLYISFHNPPAHRDSYMFKPYSKKDIGKIREIIRNHKPTERFAQLCFSATEIIPFEDIKNGNLLAPTYRYISNPKFTSAFTLICIIILAFSLLNYISLTVAFSRFRLVESATRALLGTSRWEIIFRGFAESLILVVSSCMTAVLLIIALQPSLENFFHLELQPLCNPAVIFAIVAVALLTALCAGGINYMISSRYRPIDVIKGESRYHDKAILGKLFIGLQGTICVAAVIFGIGIMLQTRELIDYQVGYNTENIISIQGDDRTYVSYKDELKSLHFVEKVGCTLSEFIKYGEGMVKRGETTTWYMTCDRTAFDMLGFKVSEYLDVPEMISSEMYINQTGWELYKSSDTSDSPNRYIGVLEDFHLGNIKEIDKSKTIFEVRIDEPMVEWIGSNILVKVSGDQYEARDAIRKFYTEKGLYSETLYIYTLEECIKANYEDENRMMRLVGVFALICMIMTGLAVIALSSYYAQMNRHDTAVRKVFGISRHEVFWKTVWGFVAPVLIGAGIAIPLSYIYFGRWLEAYPVRIENSPAIYIAALVIVLTVTIGTVILQALRLMRTNPAEALKKE